ncbi:MAG: glycine betaine/L-proline ABC transporter ATP-binding protein ProV [bacterium]
MSKLEIRGLVKVFGDHPERALKGLKKGWSKQEILERTKQTVGINNVSFTVEEGETFVVMGLSGSGKSTLVRCLNRLIEPTAGQVFIDGEDVTAMDEIKLREVRRKKLGMVFQRFGLFPHRTVQENVEYGLEVQGVEKAVRAEKARETLALVGLQGWENSYPSQLSGGMQQRVGLARALANDPDILLMDEAFSALDPLIRREMQDELLTLQAKVNKTIVFITHDLDEALRIGDRIALMKDGGVVQIGTPEEILIEPANEYVSRFVEDVDMSKILTAEGVMKSPVATIRRQDGPRVALRAMQEHGISSIFVVERGQRLVGAVMADAALEAVEKGQKTLEGIMETDVPTVHPDTLISDILPRVATTALPFAVVDGEGRLLGLLVRGAVLAGLARKGVEAKHVG